MFVINLGIWTQSWSNRLYLPYTILYFHIQHVLDSELSIAAGTNCMCAHSSIKARHFSNFRDVIISKLFLIPLRWCLQVNTIDFAPMKMASRNSFGTQKTTPTREHIFVPASEDGSHRWIPDSSTWLPTNIYRASSPIAHPPAPPKKKKTIWRFPHKNRVWDAHRPPAYPPTHPPTHLPVFSAAPSQGTKGNACKLFVSEEFADVAELHRPLLSGTKLWILRQFHYIINVVFWWGGVFIHPTRLSTLGGAYSGGKQWTLYEVHVQMRKLKLLDWWLNSHSLSFKRNLNLLTELLWRREPEWTLRI